MRVYLIKNKSTNHQVTRMLINPSEELDHLGVDGSVEINDNELTLTHSPEALGYPEASGHQTECFELDNNGLYAVEVDGVVIPFAFTPEQLPKYFNRKNPEQLMFTECKEFEEELPPDIIVLPPMMDQPV